ncbi:MAG: hypothetical protein JXR48_02840 [Candidatus Delongbacteria bacterium]|nr:hypothetical protein [Candidatus Delongbacteria bacterium]MBN2833884.1 hypothetical protein [Candidatus Delongbacteria bacterium]
MKYLVKIILLIAISAYSKIPITPELGRSGDFNSDHISGNFILDFILSDKKPNELYVATGDGISIGDLSGDFKSINWLNKVIGYGGSSAFALSYDHETLWMTTGRDSFVDDVGEFLATGTGVYRSDDYGRSWTRFEQPGLTPIQGITYDIACDSLGGVWLASYGQSIQKSDDNGETWHTLVPDGEPWKPTQYLNHRVFAAHHSVGEKIWIGTAQGINVLDDYNTAEENYQWTNFKYPQLSGNFVTGISSRYYDDNEEIWACSWIAESNSEENGISYTLDNGMTWHKTLLGTKIYSIGFSGDKVFACGLDGMYMATSEDYDNFQEYDIRILDPLSNEIIYIEKTYTFIDKDGIWFVGTPYGIIASNDLGNNWHLYQGYNSVDENNVKTYAFPNPYSSERYSQMKFMFNLSEPSGVSLTVYNFAMEEVVRITKDKHFDSGDHYISWNGKNANGKALANGAYFYKIEYDGKTEWNKFFIFE